MPTECRGLKLRQEHSRRAMPPAVGLANACSFFFIIIALFFAITAAEHSHEHGISRHFAALPRRFPAMRA